ncbi:MAG: hypothetical protein K2J51_02670 [Alistipes sp.]|nr:hypothetical protein [Alistipes sp.]MDE6778366.1 hypothetical protein [Alistipes sp.]
MTKFFKLSVCAALAAASALGTACTDGENDFTWEEERENALSLAASNFVDKTVIPTYRDLADAAVELADICAEVEASVRENAATDLGSGELCPATQALVDAACRKWYEARKHWELSEAFLYGAAADYNIDPHIDSWPLNATDLQALLDDSYRMSIMDAEYAAGLGYGLQGFHAVEYMIFDRTAGTSSTEGKPRTAAYKRIEELVYLAAVAGDMANQCVLLEASWAGMESLDDRKSGMLEDAELEPSRNYGYGMCNAGRGGSDYTNFLAVAQQILQGCSDISDEVANTKIARPNTGTSGEDLSYIESPYAKNSKTDFYDNIVSVRNAYLGTVPGAASVSSYLRSVDAEADTAVRNAIEAALAAIEAAPAPFVNYAGSNNPLWCKATEECNALTDALDNAVAAIGR